MDGFDLDVVGVLEGTDKSSSVLFSWDYLRHYQPIFDRWRNEPINLIEIGVEHGPSLKVWRTYFSRAQIIGVDINPDCRRLAGERVAIEIGSQEDPGFLHGVCAKYPPTIVIDDGSHLAHHVVYTFKHLFPALAPGGIYVVEDMKFHNGKEGERWAGDKSVSAPDYFLELARARMFHQRATDGTWGDDKYIADHIDTVSFIGGAVVIRKRMPRDIALALVSAERHLQSVDPTPAQYLRLAEFVMYHNGPLESAEQAVLEAIRIGGPSAETLRVHINILTRQGRLDRAIDVAAEATQSRPNDHAAWALLSQAERQRGRMPEAVAALEKAAAIAPDVGQYHDQLGHLLQQQRDYRRALAAAQRAVRIRPNHEPWKRRVAELEKLAA